MVVLECTHAEETHAAIVLLRQWRATMTDKPAPAPSRFAGIMNRGGKPSVGPPPTDAEIDDETVRRASEITVRMRQEVAHWRTKAESFERELLAAEHEYEAKLASARADNDSLRKQINELGIKFEHYHNLAHQLGTKTDDLEVFYLNECTRIAEHTNNIANSLIGFVNGSAGTVKAFVDDLRAKAKNVEYRREPTPRPIDRSHEDPEGARRLAQKLAPRPDVRAEPADKQQPGGS
jgi:hypothetical protein